MKWKKIKLYIMHRSKVTFSVIYLRVVLCETAAYVAHWYSMFISKAAEEREPKKTKTLPCSRLLLIHCPSPSHVPSSETPLSSSGSTRCSLGADLELKDINHILVYFKNGYYDWTLCPGYISSCPIFTISSAVV